MTTVYPTSGMILVAVGVGVIIAAVFGGLAYQRLNKKYATHNPVDEAVGSSSSSEIAGAGDSRTESQNA